MANGCCRRFHVPPRTDPAYCDLVAEQRANFEEQDAALDSALTSIAGTDFVAQAASVKKEQIASMERAVAAERNVAARYPLYRRANYGESLEEDDMQEFRRRQGS